MPIPEGLLNIYCPECRKKIREIHARDFEKAPSLKIACKKCRFNCTYMIERSADIYNGIHADRVTLFDIVSDANDFFKEQWPLNATINLAEDLFCIFDGATIGAEKTKRLVSKDAGLIYWCQTCKIVYDIRRWD